MRPLFYGQFSTSTNKHTDFTHLSVIPTLGILAGVSVFMNSDCKTSLDKRPYTSFIN